MHAPQKRRYSRDELLEIRDACCPKTKPEDTQRKEKPERFIKPVDYHRGRRRDVNAETFGDGYRQVLESSDHRQFRDLEGDRHPLPTDRQFGSSKKEPPFPPPAPVTHTPMERDPAHHAVEHHRSKAWPNAPAPIASTIAPTDKKSGSRFLISKCEPQNVAASATPPRTDVLKSLGLVVSSPKTFHQDPHRIELGVQASQGQIDTIVDAAPVKTNEVAHPTKVPKSHHQPKARSLTQATKDLKLADSAILQVGQAQPQQQQAPANSPPPTQGAHKPPSVLELLAGKVRDHTVASQSTPSFAAPAPRAVEASEVEASLMRHAVSKRGEQTHSRRAPSFEVEQHDVTPSAPMPEYVDDIPYGGYNGYMPPMDMGNPGRNAGRYGRQYTQEQQYRSQPVSYPRHRGRRH